MTQADFMKKYGMLLLHAATRRVGLAVGESNCFTMRSSRAATEHPVGGPRGLQRGKGNSESPLPLMRREEYGLKCEIFNITAENSANIRGYYF